MLRITITAAILAIAAVAQAQPAAMTPLPPDAGAVTDRAAAAPAWRFDLAVDTRWLHDRSAAAVTTDTLSTVTWSAERRLVSVDVPRTDGLELAGIASFGSGNTAGSMFQTLDTNVDTIDLLAGVHASARLFRVLVASARAEVGATRVALQIAPTGEPSMASVDDHGWGAIASASVGAELEPVATSRLRLGVGVELGYVATGAVEMHAYPSGRGDPDLSIETAYASIGRLNLGGWSLRVGGHLSF